MLTLYHDWHSAHAFGVRVVLAEKTLDWTSRVVELLRFEHLQPAYLEVNPIAQVPALDVDGQVLTESAVIAEYLDELAPDPPLKPGAPFDRARMRIWPRIYGDSVHPIVRKISFELLYRPHLQALDPLDLHALVLRHPDPERASAFIRVCRLPVNVNSLRVALDSLSPVAGRLESLLSRQPWVSGERFGLADVALSGFVDRIDHLSLKAFWEPYPEVQRWTEALLERPSVQAARPPSHLRFAAPDPQIAAKLCVGLTRSRASK